MKINFIQKSKRAYVFSITLDGKEYSGTYIDLNESLSRNGFDSITWDEVPDDWENAEKFIEESIMEMEFIKVLTVSSSRDEELFESASTFEEAEEIAISKNPESVQFFEFGTQAEVDAFKVGYFSGIGWLGNGMIYAEDKD